MTLFRSRICILSVSLLISLLGSSCLFSQVKNDSLYLVFSDSKKSDSLRFAAIDDLSNKWLFKNPDTAFYLCEQGLLFSKEKKEIKWEAIFLNTEGLSWYMKSDLIHSLETLFKSLDKWQNAPADKTNKKGLARCLGNIGLVFQNQNELDKALEYQQKALKAFQDAKDKKGIGNTLGNIGNIYDEQKNKNKAIETDKEALAVFYSISYQRGIATCHLNLADLFYQIKNIDSAVFHAEKAFTLLQKNNNKKGLSAIYSIKGRISLLNSEFKQAIDLCSEGLRYAAEITSATDKKNSCLCLSEAYQKSGNPVLALKYYKDYNDARDSLNNEDKAKQIARTELRFQFGKKTVQDSLLHVQENKMNALKISEEKKQKNYLFVIVAVALLFSFFMVNRFLVTRRQKKIISLQKEIVDEKNREITDSIRYAERIQKAVMPPEELFQKYFPQSFVLLKPKDIVSGDFYWIHQSEEYIFYATADCTGHGVPGGFMSMLGNSLLNEVVGDMGIYEPADALDVLRIKIIRALKQTNKAGENKDGMDMVLCRIKKDLTELTYSAAYNPLWIISEGKLKEYFADKQPVGFFDETPKQFTQHTISLKKFDTIYTFTDGFADQFGGPKGKKFKYRQFQNTLIELNRASVSMTAQRNDLNNIFENWKSKLEQVDDVCVIGIMI